MATPMLTFDAEMQPYINQLGDSSLPQMNRAGKGTAVFTPTINQKLSDTPASGTALPSDARHAILWVKNGGIRVRSDTKAATPTVGLYIGPNTILVFKNQRQMLEQWQMIDNSGETSEVSAMWFA